LKRITALGAALLAALVLAGTALAHAVISPAQVKAKQDQLFTLTVPTEKKDATTVRVDLTLPDGFEIDSFVPTPDWHRIASEHAVTWNGGNVPQDEDATFEFVGSADSAADYTFGVRQLYSDGSVVEWTGSPDSDTPAPVVEAKSSLSGGGGTSTATWVALVLAAFAVVLGVVALAAGRRELA
jgi:uncharacterized protein YcnI